MLYELGFNDQMRKEIEIESAVNKERKRITALAEGKVCFGHRETGNCDHSVCFGMRKLIDEIDRGN